uniref:Uncharacterized protein n=1 Tax=Trichogramma kaykai TaxID=54128 RepID=A0ABD2XNK7_9HYME
MKTSWNIFLCLSKANRINEVMALRDKFYDKIYMDSECKDVKPELESPSTTICKTEYQNSQSIVKIENENQIDNINKNIIIDFECQYVNPELKSLSRTICKTEDQSCLPVVKTENRNSD